MQSSINLDEDAGAHLHISGELKGEGLDAFQNYSASEQPAMKPVNWIHLFPPLCPSTLRILGWGWKTQAVNSASERSQQLLSSSLWLRALGWDTQRTESPEALLQGHAKAECSAQPCHLG